MAINKNSKKNTQIARQIARQIEEYSQNIQNITLEYREHIIPQCKPFCNSVTKPTLTHKTSVSEWSPEGTDSPSAQHIYISLCKRKKKNQSPETYCTYLNISYMFLGLFPWKLEFQLVCLSLHPSSGIGIHQQVEILEAQTASHHQRVNRCEVEKCIQYSACSHICPAGEMSR